LPNPACHAAFSLEYFTEVQDLSHLLASMGQGPFSARFRKLSQGLCEVVEGYGLVGFTPLAIQVRCGVVGSCSSTTSRSVRAGQAGGWTFNS
jgi:hypothetical protein